MAVPQAGFIENVNLIANYIRGNNDNIYDDINASVDLAYRWAANPYHVEPDPTYHPQEYSSYSYAIDAWNIAQEMLNHNHDDLYWPRDDFTDVGGIDEAGLPVKLTAAGMIDDSMISISSMYPVGPFLPTIAQEYPDNTGQQPGAFWTVYGLNDLGYTFTTGDLIGQTAFNGDIIIYGSTNWILRSLGELDPTAYYRLDGTVSITANFQSGGKRIVNMDDGILSTHGSTVGQMVAHVDDSIEIGTFGARRN